jgi:hypothetical protein
MVSREWHKMNSLVNEAERVAIQIANVKAHLSLNKHSIVRQSLATLVDKKNNLYDAIHDLATEMLEKTNDKN